jgi:hypothetical protein
MTPRVAMNGGSRPSTTSAAASAPLATPVRIPSATASPSGHPSTVNRCPVMTDASAITAPGARSIPPAPMIIAAPMAEIP